MALKQEFESQLGLLPEEVLRAICGLLTGYDVFRLSHTSVRWLHALDGSHFWRDRLCRATDDKDQEQPEILWKQRYVQSRSLRFGCSLSPTPTTTPPSMLERFCGFVVHSAFMRSSDLCGIRPKPRYSLCWRRGDGVCRIPFARLQCATPSARSPPGSMPWFALRGLHGRSFSFDVWFSLLPGATKAQRTVSGVIYGMQSDTPIVSHWPQHYRQVVAVDADLSLHCSVLDAKETVVHGLEPNRWYHLALSYGCARKCQRVYLDGVQVGMHTGVLFNDWTRLSHEQIGTGFTGLDDARASQSAALGWSPFHGLVDGFRVWEGAMAGEEVSTLASGEELQTRPALAVMERTRGRCGSRLKPQSVRCTRPAEGKYMQVDTIGISLH